MKPHRFLLLPLYFLLLALITGLTAVGDVGVRPASNISNEPIDWMKKVADWQLTQSRWDDEVRWEWGALHAGMMACYEATKDETYQDSCRQWAQKFDWQLAWNHSNHADNMACAQAYLELYLLDEQDTYRYQDFKNQSDDHVALWPAFNCNTTSDSNVWWWCDALFMAPPALVRLSRATGDSTYTDFMHMMWEDTQDCLYDTTEHLFFRDISYFYPRQNCIGEKMFWSRGNGWVLAGTARVLQYLPLTDPNRSRYVTLLQEMSAKLKDIQQPDGYWHSDLLGPGCYDNPETSGTGFFTFGIAWGINNGYLDAETYWPTVQAGWEALTAAVQPDGLLGWVQPVGADPQSTSAFTTDVFGVGAYLLAGSEVQKYLLAHDPNTIDCFESYSNDTALQAAWAEGGSSVVSLGDYGDNFMELTYQNDQPPYRSEATYTFASPKDVAAKEGYYLSVLVRGDVANAAERMYVRLQDVQMNSAVQVMTDTAVVQTAGWMELAFPLADFTGIDPTQVSSLTIGVGAPDVSSPTGQGTLRIDNICFSPVICVDKQADFNGNCRIDLEDFSILAGQWMDEYIQTVTPTDPGTENLVAYWPLDGNYTDAVGNHNASIVSGSGDVSFVDPGHVGQSVDFDGDSALECANSSTMNLTGGATILLWIKSSGQTDAWACVIAKGFSTWRFIRNNYSTGNEIAFHFNPADGSEFQANGSINVMDNEWHHLMGVSDGNAIYLYVDGQLDASVSTGGAAFATSTDPVYIGSRVGRLSDRSWNGQIDEVRIYDTALSEAERLWLAEQPGYTQIPDPRPTDLVLDGKINLDDLMRFLEDWTTDVYWP